MKYICFHTALILVATLALHGQAIIGPNGVVGKGGRLGPGPSPATYTAVNLCFGSTGVSCTIQHANDLVIVYAIGVGASSGATCSTSDGSVTLTNTPSSPTYNTFGGGAALCVSYYYPTTSGAKTYTTTWTAETAYRANIQDVSYTGSSAFDTDAGAFATSTATPIGTPSISPNHAGEYLGAGTFSGSSLTGITGGSWTFGSTGNDGSGMGDIYQLSGGSGSTAVNFAVTGGGTASWIGIAVAFK